MSLFFYVIIIVMEQNGFTLVELAIVMIIIGLLIGGVLKGQELISNAQVSASAAQVKATEAAMSTFQDAYGGIPGDISNPANRIPNCTGVCAYTDPTVGNNGNGRLTSRPWRFHDLLSENMAFWAQLAAADIIGGVIPDAPALEAGLSNPNFPAGGSLRIGYWEGTIVSAAIPFMAGHYVGTAGDLTLFNTPSLSPSMAFRIDNKIDDGRPFTGVSGSLRTLTGGGVGDCTDGNIDTSEYNTDDTGINCNIFVRIR